MLHRTRQIIAITLVATALMADRALAAAPRANQQIVSVACKVASRLATSFRRHVPAYRSVETRTAFPAPQPVTRALPAPTPEPARFAFSPFQFRLPPPGV